MKKYGHSSSSLFLLEIILNILLFSVLLTTSLQIIMKAHTLTQKTSELHRAVTLCTNVANCFESGDGSLKSIREIYTSASTLGERVMIYFDNDFFECPKETATYAIEVSYSSDADLIPARITGASITCTKETETIYSIEAYYYAPLSPQAKIGGGR